MSPSSSDTQKRISEVRDTLPVLSKQTLSNEEDRKQLLAILREQIGILESPLEVIWRMMMEVSYMYPSADSCTNEISNSLTKVPL